MNHCNNRLDFGFISKSPEGTPKCVVVEMLHNIQEDYLAQIVRSMYAQDFARKFSTKELIHGMFMKCLSQGTSTWEARCTLLQKFPFAQYENLHDNTCCDMPFSEKRIQCIFSRTTRSAVQSWKPGQLWTNSCCVWIISRPAGCHIGMRSVRLRFER